MYSRCSVANRIAYCFLDNLDTLGGTTGWFSQLRSC